MSSFRKILIMLGLALSSQVVLAKTFVYEEMKCDASDEKRTLVITDAKSVKDSEVVIPGEIEYEGVKYAVVGVAEKAFYHNDSVKVVSLPNGLSSLGDFAFGHCSQLKSIHIPSSLTSLGAGAFYGCSNLETADFEKGEKGLPIKENTFYDCQSLQSLGSCLISDTIGNLAFSNCQSLAGSLNLRKVRFIGDKAFYKCFSLTDVSFGESCSIGSYAFYACKKLGEVNLTNPLFVGDHCFMGCYSVKTAILRYTKQYELNEIGDSCFMKCSALETVKILDYSGYEDGEYDPDLSVEICKLGNEVFIQASALKEIYVPAVKFDEYKNATDWAPYSELLVALNTDDQPEFSDTIEVIEGWEHVGSIPDDSVVEGIIEVKPTLEGKRVIVFGDSKAEGVGNQVNGEFRSWAYYMQEEYGCVVTNAAVGGTHLTPASLKPTSGVNGLGVYSLVNAWKTEDYSLVDSSISWAHQNKYGTRWDHVQEIIKTTKATDYDIVCIDAGTNDWNNAARVLGNWEDTNPLQNYTVALKNIITTLYELNPKLHILIIPPIVRQLTYNDTTTFSDYYLNPKSKLYLYEVAETMISVAQRCGADAIDAYHEMGFTVANWTSTYTDDGTHPNEAGYRVIGDKIGAHLLSKMPSSELTGMAPLLPSRGVSASGLQGKVTVVDLNGRVLRKNVDASKIADELPRGVYLLNGKKCVVRGK